MTIGLDGRSRDRDGEIRHKRRDTLIHTLRQHYGQNFAAGWSDFATLGDLLDAKGLETLDQYLHLHHRR